MVVPLAAVTVTVNVFAPVTSSSTTSTTTAASGSVASATYSTSVVPKGRFTVAPVATSEPLIANTPRVASSFSRTFKVTV